MYATPYQHPLSYDPCSRAGALNTARTASRRVMCCRFELLSWLIVCIENLVRKTRWNHSDDLPSTRPCSTKSFSPSRGTRQPSSMPALGT